MFHKFVNCLLIVLFIGLSSRIVGKYQSVHDPFIDVAILFDQSYTMLNYTDNPIWDEMKNWVAYYYTRDLGPDVPHFAVMGCGTDLVVGVVFATLTLDGDHNSLINETDYVKLVWRAIDWERNGVSGSLADNVAGCALSARKNIFKEEYGDRPNATNLVLYVSDCLLWENTGPQSKDIHQLINKSSAVFLFICTTDPFDKSSSSNPYLNHMLEWVFGNNDSIFAFSNRESLIKRLNKILPKINISVTDCNETIVESDCAPQANDTCARNVTSYIFEPPYPKQYGKECTKNGSELCYPSTCDCNLIPWEENGGPCLNGKKTIRKQAAWCNVTTEVDCTVWTTLELASTVSVTTLMTGTTKESTDTTKRPIGSTIGTSETTAESADNATKSSGTAKVSSSSAKKSPVTTQESQSTDESTKESREITTNPPETATGSSGSVTGTATSVLPEKDATESSDKTLIIVGVIGGLFLLIVLIVIGLVLVCQKGKKSRGTSGYSEGTEAEHLVKERSTMANMDSKVISEGTESRSDVKTRQLHADASHVSSESSFSVPITGNKSAKEGKSSKLQASKSVKEGKSSKIPVKKSVPGSPSSGGKSSRSHQSNKSAAVPPAGSVKERKSTKSSPSVVKREKVSGSQGKKSTAGPMQGGKSSVVSQGKKSVVEPPSSSSKGTKPSISQGKKSTVGPSSSVKSGKSAIGQGNKSQISGKSVKSQKASKSSKK